MGYSEILATLENATRCGLRVAPMSARRPRTPVALPPPPASPLSSPLPDLVLPTQHYLTNKTHIAVSYTACILYIFIKQSCETHKTSEAFLWTMTSQRAGKDNANNTRESTFDGMTRRISDMNHNATRDVRCMVSISVISAYLGTTYRFGR